MSSGLQIIREYKGLGTLTGTWQASPLRSTMKARWPGQSISPDFSRVRAFLWQNGSMIDVNTLVTANPAKLHLLSGVSINFRKEITGLAVDGARAFHGYVAVPKHD